MKYLMYLLYRISWRKNHYGHAFSGCEPACYHEWCMCELEDMLEHPKWYSWYYRLMLKFVSN